MTRSSRWLVTGSLLLTLVGTPRDAAADSCGESGGTDVGLTAALGVGAGAAGALGSSGVLAAADDTKDFAFGVGAGVGIGVTAGLSAIYFVVDLSTGCGMVNDSDGIVWSVPISTILVGSLLPIAIWGASDDIDATGEEQAALVAPGRGPSGQALPGLASLTLRF